MHVHKYIEDTPESLSNTLIIARDLLEKGQYIQANDYMTQALEVFPDNLKLRELHIQSLLKIGATEKALEASQELISLVTKTSDLDSSKIEIIKTQTWKMMGEVYFEIWKDVQTEEFLVQALEYTSKSFNKNKTPTTGIFISTLIFLLSKKVNKEQINAYINQLQSETLSEQSFIYIGIAYLLQNSQNEAYAYVKKFLQYASNNFSLISELNKQLRILIANGLSVDDRIVNLMKMPAIVVFEGPSVKQINDWGYELTPELELRIKNEIHNYLDKLDAKIGFSTASSGTDIIFLESMLERGGEINIILPFDISDYLKIFVSYADKNWDERFHACINRASSVTYSSRDRYLENPAYYQFAYRIEQGLTISRGHILSAPAYFLVAWNSEILSDPMENISAAIDHWCDLTTLRIIDLNTLLSSYEKKESKKLSTLIPEINYLKEHSDEDKQYLKKEITIKSMLFSDLVGFSKLDNFEIINYINHLNKIRNQLNIDELLDYKAETQGDSLFVLMDNPYQMATYALELCDYLSHQQSLSPNIARMEMRIALHAGFVFKVFNPMTQRDTYYGQSIVRVARLEPVTVPGKIYATSEFVSLLTLELERMKKEAQQLKQDYITPIKIDFVGTIELAKKFGREFVYKIEWTPAYIAARKGVGI